MFFKTNVLVSSYMCSALLLQCAISIKEILQALCGPPQVIYLRYIKSGLGGNNGRSKTYCGNAVTAIDDSGISQ